MKFSLPLVCCLLIAAALRLPGLSDRPMHADEAIQADRFATLIAQGGFRYDAADFHGPVLLLAGLPIAWALNARSLADLNESMLRCVSALAGLSVVAMSFLLALPSGRSAGLAAAAFTSVSPGLIYFSRFYIAEMLLLASTAILLWLVFRYAERPTFYRAALAGTTAGIAFATKETAVLSFAAILVAMGFTRLRISSAHALTACLTASATAALLISSFGRHPGAAFEAFTSPWLYAQRALSGNLHVHPAWYYLSTAFQSGEGWVVLGSLAGAGFLWRHSRDVRFWTVYSITLLVLYSALRYKTPWSALAFLHGFLILGGIVAGHFCKTRIATTACVVALIALGCQALRLAFPLAVDRANPWAYAQSTSDVVLVGEKVRQLAKLFGSRVQIVSAENCWPLPWYLRSVPAVEWSRTVPHGRPPAPVILTSPGLEAEVAEYVYESRREGPSLYVALFAQPVFIRPGVEIRGYSLASLQEGRNR